METFTRIIDVNLRGVMLGTKHAARAMRAAGTAGAIINLGSVAGLRGLEKNASEFSSKLAPP